MYEFIFTINVKNKTKPKPNRNSRETRHMKNRALTVGAFSWSVRSFGSGFCWGGFRKQIGGFFWEDLWGFVGGYVPSHKPLTVRSIMDLK